MCSCRTGAKWYAKSGQEPIAFGSGLEHSVYRFPDFIFDPPMTTSACARLTAANPAKAVAVAAVVVVGVVTHAPPRFG